MDELYIHNEFEWNVVLRPDELDAKMNDRIKDHLFEDLENKCIRNIGHIKANSIKINTIMPGIYSGSHTTGNVLFKVKLSCMAAQPVKGAVINCRVTGKNNAGILATNYAVPFLMFIPKDVADINSAVEHEQVSLYDTVEVEMLDWKLQPPPDLQYWIICRISSIKLNATVVTALPKETLPTQMLWKPDFNQEINNTMREELTGDWFSSLKMIREKIDTTIKQGYITKLKNLSDPFTDFVMASCLRQAQKKTTRFGTDASCKSWKATLLTDDDTLVTIRTALAVSKNDIYVNNGIIYVISEEEDMSSDDTEEAGLEYHINVWSTHIRKLVNEYELLRPDGDYRDQLKGLIHIPPADKNVSRAYYKLYEMLKMKEDSLNGNHIFNGTNAGQKILCMGEAPGGFINALIDLYGTYGHTITGISISEDRKREKVWGRLEDLFRRQSERYKHVHKMENMEATEVTEAGTFLRLIGDPEPYNQQPGDVLNLSNQHTLTTFYQKPEDKAILITADGGAPHDIDAESEIHHSRLIFGEILLALKCQKEGGNFILKIFDITTAMTLNMISILSHFYERVHLYKPKTSRMASSEKYLICMYFMPRDMLQTIITNMEKILEEWSENLLVKNEQLHMLFENTPKMMTAMKNYNDIFMQQQTHFIRTGIEYAEKYNTLAAGSLEKYIGQTVQAQYHGPCAFFKE
jgi:23S rRNA U2552 (ribose-2'-O)-methylase RlmE/FtsJ/DNA-directed RNA polymerase subunit E'/Rpb7